MEDKIEVGEYIKDELRLVHYSYYNGCDEPSIYELEEI